MVASAWDVTEELDVPAGVRYVVVNTVTGEEWMVLHSGISWKFWNGNAMVEPRAAVKAAVLAYERKLWKR